MHPASATPQHVVDGRQTSRKKPNLRLDLSRDQSKHEVSEDQRRNLYVLGLPQHLSLDQFTEIFAPFGTVSHAVILAVLDAFSRRRGFVVMSRNREAIEAMKHLSGTNVQGQKIHVSWAVVQRSNGFLDGADRSPYTHPQALPVSPMSPSFASKAPTLHTAHSALSYFDSSPRHLTLEPLAKPAYLLLSNLHPSVFQSTADILPLIAPYGPVRSVKLVNPGEYETNDSLSPVTTLACSPISPVDTKAPPLAAVAEFFRFEDAARARMELDGQLYGCTTGPGLKASFLASAQDQMKSLERSSFFAAQQDYQAVAQHESNRSGFANSPYGLHASSFVPVYQSALSPRQYSPFYPASPGGQQVFCVPSPTPHSYFSATVPMQPLGPRTFVSTPSMHTSATDDVGQASSQKTHRLSSLPFLAVHGPQSSA